MARKKSAKKKTDKKEPWRHEHVSGKAHPDHNPPLQVVAQASDEAAEKETQALDGEILRQNAPDWAALPGGTPADPSRPAADNPKPKVTKTAAAKTSPATDTAANTAPGAVSGTEKR